MASVGYVVKDGQTYHFSQADYDVAFQRYRLFTKGAGGFAFFELTPTQQALTQTFIDNYRKLGNIGVQRPIEAMESQPTQQLPPQNKQASISSQSIKFPQPQQPYLTATVTEIPKQYLPIPKPTTYYEQPKNPILPNLPREVTPIPIKGYIPIPEGEYRPNKPKIGGGGISTGEGGGSQAGFKQPTSNNPLGLPTINNPLVPTAPLNQSKYKLNIPAYLLETEKKSSCWQVI